MSQAAVTTASAEEITKASKSNLALAFVALSPERRADISVFYAFCRIIDDLADEEGVPPNQRRAGLDAWKRAVASEAAEPEEPPMAPAVRALRHKYGLSPELFLEIIAGCEMDLSGTRYQTWEDLRLYCYRVASAVGLVSVEIFGYRDPRCRQYAIELGLALQLTNIIRDVGVDWDNGQRIYLPLQEMAAHGYTEADLAAGRENDAFRALMAFEDKRAEELYARADAALPLGDKRSMVAAEIMRTVYHRLLRQIRRHRYHVLKKRHRLWKIEKIGCILKVLWQRRHWPEAKDA